MIDKKLATKSRPHQTYYLADGTKVPGVTTVLGIIAKPAMSMPLVMLAQHVMK